MESTKIDFTLEGEEPRSAKPDHGAIAPEKVGAWGSTAPRKTAAAQQPAEAKRPSGARKPAAAKKPAAARKTRK
jgi:hypothetical protein